MVTNSNLKKSLYTLKVKIMVYKGPRTLKKIPNFSFLGEKYSKLATLI
jgi:hypothetical protein